MPACGYRVLKLRAAEGPPAQGEPSEGTTIESDTYRVTFDPPHDGGSPASSTRNSARNWWTPGPPSKLNQYVYAAGGKDTKIVNMTGKPVNFSRSPPPGRPRARKLRFGTMGEMMIVETSGTMAPKITSRVIVEGIETDRHHQSSRQDADLRQGRGVLRISVRGRTPDVPLRGVGRVVCANTGMLPGGCREWFTVQHFVEIDRGDAAITWARPTPRWPASRT